MPASTKPAKAAKPLVLSKTKKRDGSAASTPAPPPKKAKKAAEDAPTPAKVEKGTTAPAPTPAAPAKAKKVALATAQRAAVDAQAAMEDMAAEAGASKKASRKAGAKAVSPARGISLPTLKGKAEAKKLAPKGPVASPPEDSDNDEAEDEGAASGEEGAVSDDDLDADVHLHGFSSDGEDSSDDDDDDVAGADIPGIDVASLPTIAKDDATVKRRLDRAKKEKSEERGVLYLGRIPHGFYEAEMRAYFTQFGDVTRVRISRNKKTGASKHYGFIEMGSRAVAAIVADTMDNYLLAGHILRCKLLSADEVRPELWIGANRAWRKVPRDRVARVAHNKERTGEDRAKVEDRLLRRQNEKKRKLSVLGIDYDFGEAEYKKSRPAVSSTV